MLPAGKLTTKAIALAMHTITKSTNSTVKQIVVPNQYVNHSNINKV